MLSDTLRELGALRLCSGQVESRESTDRSAFRVRGLKTMNHEPSTMNQVGRRSRVLRLLLAPVALFSLLVAFSPLFAAEYVIGTADVLYVSVLGNVEGGGGAVGDQPARAPLQAQEARKWKNPDGSQVAKGGEPSVE